MPITTLSITRNNKFDVKHYEDYLKFNIFENNIQD